MTLPRYVFYVSNVGYAPVWQKSNGKVELNCFPVTSAVWFTHPLSCSDSSCGCLLQGELNVKRKHTLVPVTADWALGHILQDSETSIMSQPHSGMENARFRMQSDCRFNRVHYRFCLPFILTPSSLQSQWICTTSKCCTIVQQKNLKNPVYFDFTEIQPHVLDVRCWTSDATVTRQMLCN